MKQCITINQLNELTDKGKERLREWWAKKGLSRGLKDGDGFYTALPILSVGQMIEFLDENRSYPVVNDESGELLSGCIEIKNATIWWDEETNLCDALWEACREVLSG